MKQYKQLNLDFGVEYHELSSSDLENSMISNSEPINIINIINKVFEDTTIRIIFDENKNQHWFVLKDVLNALKSATRPADAKMSIFQGLGDGVANDYPIIDSMNRVQQVTCIAKPAVTYLVDRSNTETGNKLRRFIHLKVLPEIERTGEKLNKIANNLEKIDYLPNNQYITVEDGTPYTTSTIISQFFEIRHADLLRLIDNKINNLLNLDDDKILKLFNKDSLEDDAILRSPLNQKLFLDVKTNINNFINDNFIKSEYLSKDNKMIRQYKLTEQGFSFIVMGLTGVKADIYKIAFVKSFYEMRKIITDRLKSTYLRKTFPNKTNDDQFVYIIQNSLVNLFKIGKSKHVEKRLKELETGAACELKLIYKSMLCTNSFEIENILHKKYKSVRQFKEWFRLDDVQEVIDYIENNINVELTSDFDELKYLCDITKLDTYLFKPNK